MDLQGRPIDFDLFSQERGHIKDGKYTANCTTSSVREH